MQIVYNAETDLLYLRFDDHQQHVISKRLSEGIILTLGDDDRIVGIEILDASRHLNLNGLFACGTQGTARQSHVRQSGSRQSGARQTGHSR